MAVPSNRGRANDPGRKFNRLLTRAETVTLLGMILCIFSLFLKWPLPMSGKVPMSALSPAMVVNMTRTGALMDDVKWPVTAAAILSGLLLAVAPAGSSRMPLTFVQALCGLVCFIIALMHFGMLPGPLIDLAGGGLLTFGAVDRMGQIGAGER